MLHETANIKPTGCRACPRHDDAVRNRSDHPPAGDGVASGRAVAAVFAAHVLPRGTGSGARRRLGAGFVRRQPHAGVARQGAVVPAQGTGAGWRRETVFVCVCRQRGREALRLPRRPLPGPALGHCAQPPPGRPQGAASGARPPLAAQVGRRAVAAGRDARLLSRTLLSTGGRRSRRIWTCSTEPSQDTASPWKSTWTRRVSSGTTTGR